MSQQLYITPWRCTLCVGGRTDDGRCYHCGGSGLTSDPVGSAVRAPRPPGVMGRPCGDCAYRPGSPEREALGQTLPEDEPFFCHLGAPVNAAGEYVPVAMFRGLPLGLMVCAGWWAARTGEPLPDREFRERPFTAADVRRAWGSRPQIELADPDPQGAAPRGGHGEQAPRGEER